MNDGVMTWCPSGRGSFAMVVLLAEKVALRARAGQYVGVGDVQRVDADRMPGHRRSTVSVRLNHTIVWCRDQERSARFLAEMLGRPVPTRFGPFLVVELDNDASLDFHETERPIA